MGGKSWESWEKSWEKSFEKSWEKSWEKRGGKSIEMAPHGRESESDYYSERQAVSLARVCEGEVLPKYMVGQPAAPPHRRRIKVNGRKVRVTCAVGKNGRRPDLPSAATRLTPLGPRRRHPPQLQVGLKSFHIESVHPGLSKTILHAQKNVSGRTLECAVTVKCKGKDVSFVCTSPKAAEEWVWGVELALVGKKLSLPKVDATGGANAPPRSRGSRAHRLRNR